MEQIGLHRDQVDHSFEVRLGADRAVDRDRVGVELFSHRLDGIEKVSADPVHFIDERDPRNAIALRLAPNGFGLRLNASYGVRTRRPRRRGRVESVLLRS